MTQNEIWNVSKAIFWSIGGASAIIFGLSSFLSKVWAERILSKEKHALDIELAGFQQKSSELLSRLQATVDRVQHVNRATFDREFEIYRATWDKIVDLRMAGLSLRPCLREESPVLST